MDNVKPEDRLSAVELFNTMRECLQNPKLWFGHLERMGGRFWPSKCQKFEVGGSLAKYLTLPHVSRHFFRINEGLTRSVNVFFWVAFLHLCRSNASLTFIFKEFMSFLMFSNHSFFRWPLGHAPSTLEFSMIFGQRSPFTFVKRSNNLKRPDSICSWTF